MIRETDFQENSSRLSTRLNLNNTLVHVQMMGSISARMDHAPLMPNTVAPMAHNAHLTYLLDAITLETVLAKVPNV